MEKPELTVLIPTYNHAGYLRPALDSVFAQTLPPDEVIVADDGSTDDTLQVLEAYAGRIRVLSEPHRGIGATYNSAVQHAQGRLVAFLESDDALEPDYLEECVRFLERDPEIAWVSTARRIVDKDGVPTGRIAGKKTPGPYFTTERFLSSDLGTSWTPVVKREAIQEVGPFATDTHVADSEMALRFSVHFGMGYLDRPLYRYRRHGTNVSGAALHDTRELLRVLREFQLREVDYVRRNERTVRRALAKYCGRVASLMLAEDPQASRSAVLALLREATRHDPFNFRNYRRYAAVALLGARLSGHAKRLSSGP